MWVLHFYFALNAAEKCTEKYAMNPCNQAPPSIKLTIVRQSATVRHSVRTKVDLENELFDLNLNYVSFGLGYFRINIIWIGFSFGSVCFQFWLISGQLIFGLISFF